MNTTKFVHSLSYLVRLDCFQMLQIAILAEMCIKVRYFCRKIAKIVQN